MSNTMIHFKETIEEIHKLRKQEARIIEEFENSTCEFSKCFHWILKAALEGETHCCLSVITCSECHAKELKNMGFDVTEMKNVDDVLCGYEIKWR